MQIINQIRNPLSETTRKARRNLLITSVSGIAIIKVGLVPEKISAFGIESSQINQEYLIYLLVGMVIYFLISFAFYMYSEWNAYKIAKEYETKEMEQEVLPDNKYTLKADEVREYLESINNLRESGNIYLYVRLFLIEIGIPVIIAAISIFLLLFSEVEPSKVNTSAYFFWRK